MLESRVIRELCRNGKPLGDNPKDKSDTAVKKSLEQERPEAILTSQPSLERSRGYFYGSIGRAFADDTATRD